MKKNNKQFTFNKSLIVIARALLCMSLALILIFTNTINDNGALHVNAASSDYVILTPKAKTLKVGDEAILYAVTLSGKLPQFRSSASKIASVNSYGVVTAKKPGTCKITAKVKGNESYCYITVLETKLTINKSSIDLYKNGTFQLLTTTSTGNKVTFKSKKTSVATVNESGLITAKKNGTAIITISCDGTTKECVVNVLKPVITLTPDEVTIKVGEKYRINAKSSSNNPVTYSVSNINILSVNKGGIIKGRQKGKAYLYASDDGTKVSAIIHVIE